MDNAKTETLPAVGRKARRVLFAFGVLVALVLVAAFAGKELAERKIGDRLRETAARRGLVVSWQDVELGLDGRIEVSGVTFHTEREGRFEGEIESIETKTTISAILAGERPTVFRIRGAVVTLDSPGLQGIRSKQDGEPATALEGSDALELSVDSLDAVFELDDEHNVACHASALAAQIHPVRAMSGTVTCRSSIFGGVESGDLHVTATHDPGLAPEPWQVELTPAEGFRPVAGMSVNHIRASLGDNQAHVQLAELELDADQAELDLGVEGLSVDLDSVEIALQQGNDGWFAQRIEAGPGRVLLRSSTDPGIEATEVEASLTDAEPPDDEDQPEALPLNELEASADQQPAPQLDWQEIEGKLRRVEELLATSMALATSLADRVDVADISVSVETGPSQIIPATLTSFTALPGQATLLVQFAEHEISAAIENAVAPESEAGLVMVVTVDHLDLAKMSETIGRAEMFSGVADAQLTVTTGDVFELKLTFNSPDLVFRHDSVSPEPIALLPVQGETQVRLSSTEDDRLLITTEGSLGEHVRGTAVVRVRETDDGPRLTAEFSVDEARCRHLLQSIPEGLFLHMDRDDIRLRGRSGLDGTVRYTFGNHRSFSLSFGETFPGTCEITRMPRGFRPEVVAEDDYRHVVSENYTTETVVVGPGTSSWVPMEDLPTYIPAIMYLTEQRNFYDDPAISVSLISKAVRVNLIFGRWAYGGSTVTQQLVKNLFLDRGKTLARKLEEAIVSWALEEVVSKDRVLELYLNCIEFGPDVWGIGTAAEYYFGIPATELSPIQASYLAGLKPAPRSGGSHRRRGRSPRRQRWQDRLLHHIQLLADRGFISQDYVDAQESFIIPLGEAVEPRIAPID